MDKVEKILERYKVYLGVKDVKLVVRPYETRTAFTNLSSSPPTIYLNEYLIDDEEIVEYLIIRELIHIKLHMYPPMRYGVPSLSYTEKFESNLYFLIPKEKVEEIREKMEKKLIEVNGGFSNLFFLLFMEPRLMPRGGLLLRDNVGKRRGKRGLFVCRYRLTGIIIPVGLSLSSNAC